MKKIGEKITVARKRKGLSQEKLAEMANLSLRTIQRIENNESEPRGHTLSSICDVLEINIEDILDYGKVADKTFFIYFHLSVMVAIVFPFGDIILPFILWIMKKDQIIGLNKQGKNLLTFRIIYNVISMSLLFLIVNLGSGPLLYFAIHFVVTLLYPIFVAISIYRSDELKDYYPRFFK